MATPLPAHGHGPWGQVLRSHARRIGIAVITLCLNRFVRRAFGVVNRRVGWLASVFVMYPATERYASQVAYPGRIKRCKWAPFPVMLIKQGRHWCMVFAISSFEGEVRKGGLGNLQRLVERARVIQEELGATNLTFSGILPGLLEKKGVPHEGSEAQTTVRVVADALDQVTQQVGYDSDTPVILLGGGGYIGQRLAHRLQGRPVHVVDPKGGESMLPVCLRGKRAILVNVASRRALAGYLGEIWEGLVLLNEVYPEPTRLEVQRLGASGVPAFHVVGVKAKAFPPFPGAYRGGAPCCAAIPGADLDALVRQL